MLRLRVVEDCQRVAVGDRDDLASDLVVRLGGERLASGQQYDGDRHSVTHCDSFHGSVSGPSVFPLSRFSDATLARVVVKVHAEAADGVISAPR